MTKISDEHLARRACVYIRQSTPDQVQNNLESQRRQYALADRAKQLGWVDVEVIDEDLGCSGSGAPRLGFERLLGNLCDGKVGAVLSIDASRLARNGRDWHTLLEFCSVVGALLIDADGVYDASQINDRLLLGMKGTISEMEVATFRQRAQGALEQKAKRGELFRRVAVGYVRVGEDRIEKDPDERVRVAIDMVFRKFSEIGSARQLYFWLVAQQMKLPAIRGTRDTAQTVWKIARYHAVLSMLKNPIYAGAYAYGRSKATTRIEQGRRRTVRQKQHNREAWAVLITDHHESYITWEVYKRNQELIAHNANAMGDMVRGSIRGGGALLSGILRCGHCGRKLLAQYPGPGVIRYQCGSHILEREKTCCVSFGGLRADRTVTEYVLASLKPLGIQAALRAIEQLQGADDERVRQKELALQQARYEVSRARRQYDAVDPLNRLVAAELERRWNEALKVESQLAEELSTLQCEKMGIVDEAMKAELVALGEDLPRLWDHSNTPAEFKKRILRIVLKEIVASTRGDTIQLVLHWQGGDHTELNLEKTSTGAHRYITDSETIELMRSLARIQPDAMIASILNRVGRRTAHGQSFNAMRVCSLRNAHSIEVFREGERQARGELTVREVASMLEMTETTVLRLIRQKRLQATQACPNAPWILSQDTVNQYLNTVAQRKIDPKPRNVNQMSLDIQ
jgi:DNA invertase Pin-like site-specific DNA recombinase